MQAGAAAQQCRAPSRRSGGSGDEPPLPDLPAALAAAHAGVARAAPDNELVDLAETLVKAYQNSSDVLDLGTATQALEALSLLAAATEGDPYRGAVLLERGTLLEAIVRPEASQAALELGARLLQKQALPNVELTAGPGGSGYAARAAVKSQDAYTTSMQRWVIGRLLQVRAGRHCPAIPALWPAVRGGQVTHACMPARPYIVPSNGVQPCGPWVDPHQAPGCAQLQLGVSFTAAVCR